MGLAARFVSVYLIQLTADVKALDGTVRRRRRLHRPALRGPRSICRAQAGSGSIRRRACSPAKGHIPLAATPDPFSAAPVTGALDECETEFVHEMHVRRIHESPRVTKPYTDEQWAEIDALGRRIDADLSSADVRLTMGGEPTFVSIDDYGRRRMERGRALVRRSVSAQAC
jgi:hypothetical protein